MRLTLAGLRLSKPARHVLMHPLGFVLQVLRGFNKNQGMMLAGAIAYYALLSMVPLLILSVIVISHWVDSAELLVALGRYLEWLVPSQSQAVLSDIAGFLESRIAIGAVLLMTMLFFSSLAFGILGKAMAVIFPHRGTKSKRHPVVSVVLPYCFVVLLGVALLFLTLASSVLQSMAQENVYFLGRNWSLFGISGLFLYLLGFGAEVLIVAALYLAFPVGRMPLHHAAIGGMVVSTVWEIVRHVLVWYFTTLSKTSVVYGSFTTTVVALFSMEIIATLLLLGAQVISEYERLEQD
ncbi:MAG: YihY/virulence factor BrkB family protein [Rhodoferax sp.]|nr:YihY/virulence factor BrkB family protein [Rhodoferax sp.]MDP3654380.1 YihY/virulence factor BrkB family protein [Rhodoferax sp.]